MPSMEDSAQPYRLLKVRNLESSKRDHFRPDPVPFDRPMTFVGMAAFAEWRYVEQNYVITAPTAASTKRRIKSSDDWTLLGSVRSSFAPGWGVRPNGSAASLLST